MNILVATTNQGKLREIMSYFQTLPYTFLSLADLSYEIKAPEETGENSAIFKAKYYAERTGILTLAEDSCAVLALYHPETKESFLIEGSSTDITPESVDANALNRMKFFIQKQYGSKHIVVPYSLIIKEGKLLMSLRNDPFRPDHHEKWEFPGGSVEYGESLEESVVRETKEETGYEVEILAQLKYIQVERQAFPNGFSYQVYLIPFVCKIVGGDGIPRDEESLKTDWFELDQVLSQNLVAGNDHMIMQILPELKEVISNIILC